MVLVDTSVWIRALANREPYVRQLDALLGRDEVIGHQFIFGELLIGDRGGRKRFLAAYERIQQAPTVFHHEVVAFARARQLHGRGMGWIDVHILASAVVGGLRLWTADERFASMAEEFGIAYEPVSS
jgi:predicted nucleic acid-binding protein